MSNIAPPVEFKNDTLFLIDQRLLPLEENFVSISSLEDTHSAIKDMVVRGAPCIGFTAIFGMALGIKALDSIDLNALEKMGEFLISARPTAVNLKFEVFNIIAMAKSTNVDKEHFYKQVVDYGTGQLELSEKRNRSMAEYARTELNQRLGKETYNILTHCNTGFLACGSVGTALGVIQNLSEKQQIGKVWVDETRPYLQGSRLTSYELTKLNIDHRIVVEGAASYLMKNNLVDAIFTGADRIVANGDTANKVGTSNLAILAKHYKIPFYIVAPSSTFDLELGTGDEIEIELRDENEILQVSGSQIAPRSARAFNPSFDITSGEHITGIISEFGTANGDYPNTLKDILG